MFQIQKKEEGTEIHVGSPTFEAAHIEEFKGLLERELPHGATNVSIDLSAVEMIDSSAIGALLSVQKRLGDPNERVTIRGARPAVLTVIELLRLHRVSGSSQ